ncbi:MAG: ABC-ATPase domain-containing protein [Methylococcaceae bacterium]|nr:ABC-ATPase domain-containing protein [Methylococcaceae bacterium]
MKKLNKLIESIADQTYQKIHVLKGDFQFPGYGFSFLKIQGSPGANPASIASIRIAIDDSELPRQFLDESFCRLAVADFLIRRFKQGIDQFAQQNRGKEGSGSFHTIQLGQKMMQRDCVLFSEKDIELRFIFSLPGKGSGGGVFDAEQAIVMFEQELKQIIDYALYYKGYAQVTRNELNQYLDIQIKRQQIRCYLEQNDYTVFINNGASLPRLSGIDDRPARGSEIQSFQSPESCQVEIPLSDNNSIQGMAIKEGITCITGGGYHGKSTLLQAILAGVYAHIPGDGREYIVSRDDAVFIGAEQGRSIRCVDISPFIGQLPNAINTEQFTTENASGSTSQAACIVESLEVGSRLLLFDEDTCATNFLFRDELIKKVLSSANEPIKPLYSTIRSIWKQHQISMIFVVGGLGSFLQKADTCLLMDNYQCRDITGKVRAELGAIVEEQVNGLNFSVHRYLSADNFNPAYTNQRLKKEIPIRIKSLRNAPRQLEYGMDLVNLEALPQIAEAPQILSIGYCLLQLRKEMQTQVNETGTIDYWLKWLYEKLEQQGLSFLQPDYPGSLSLPRRYEVAAAINRIRSLKILDD